VIARPLPYDDDVPGLRVGAPGGTRAGRGAVARRRATTRRRRYAPLANIFTFVAVPTLAVLVYLALMANVVWLNYRLVHAQADRSQLVEITAQLDRRIAERESRERLAGDAARLGMREAQSYAEIALPPSAEPRPERGLALLDFWPR